jgi:hypothetical protein
VPKAARQRRASFVEFTMTQLMTVLAMLLFFFNYANADVLNIRLASQPTSSAIIIEAQSSFDHPATIYNWSAKSTMYPIINAGLNIECKRLDDNQNCHFRPAQRVMPKFPHEKDTVTATNYIETFTLVPSNKNNSITLGLGSYSIKVVYDTTDLAKYPGGRKLTQLHLESNEIQFTLR